MELKPFMSDVNSWRRHFKDTISKGYNKNKKFHVVQKGSGFPGDNVISVSPTKQTEEIAKSQVIEINKSADRNQNNKVKRKTKSNHRKRKSDIKKVVKVKRKMLSHKKKYRMG